MPTRVRLAGPALLALSLCVGAVLALGPAVHAQTPDPIEVAFRRQVTAVIGAEAVLLSEVEGATRRLKVGEEYRDGWRLVTLAAEKATLRKGSEEKLVDLAAYPDEAAEAKSVGPVIVTNARPEGSPRPKMAEVAAFIAAGDAKAVFAAGGGPAQIINALRTAATSTGRGAVDVDTFLAGVARTDLTVGTFGSLEGVIRLGPDGQPIMILTTGGGH